MILRDITVTTNAMKVQMRAANKVDLSDRRFANRPHEVNHSKRGVERLDLQKSLSLVVLLGLDFM